VEMLKLAGASEVSDAKGRCGYGVKGPKRAVPVQDFCLLGWTATATATAAGLSVRGKEEEEEEEEEEQDAPPPPASHGAIHRGG
jgi:hypothetical protein